MVKRESIVMACRKAWEKAGRGRMLLGVSGGADSTALLVAFSKAAIPFEVAHCNFNLRSMESIRDREFVSLLCRNFGIRLHLAEFETTRLAEKGESTEMTCRRLRYDYFRRLKSEGDFGRIVIGHNADDNIETFFLNALRGAGSKGLKGMEEDNGTLLRPLLKFNRKKILAFLREQNQAYVTDSSNLKSDDYRRNFLRNEVIPLLKTRWEGLETAIDNTMAIERRENRIVEHFTAQALKGISDFLPWHIIYDFPDRETLAYKFIRPFGGTPSIAAEMAESATAMQPGKKWKLTDDNQAVFTRKGIQILHEPKPSERPGPSYRWTEINPDKADMDEIRKAPLTVAYLSRGEEAYCWKPADMRMKIKSLGLGGSQPVWKVLKDSGIPAGERGKFMVLVDRATGEPVWVPGIKRSRLDLALPGSPIFLLSPL